MGLHIFDPVKIIGDIIQKASKVFGNSLQGILGLILLLTFSSCKSGEIGYYGVEYAPTGKLEEYNASTHQRQEFEEMGQMIVTLPSLSDHMINTAKNKMMRKAQNKGADVIKFEFPDLEDIEKESQVYLLSNERLGYEFELRAFLYRKINSDLYYRIQ